MTIPSAFSPRWTPDVAGPRPEPTHALPVLTVGVDVLPTRCLHCRSQFLERQPGTLRDPLGRLVCATCSRDVCALRFLPRATRPRSVPPKAAPAPARQEPPEWRLPGCSKLCRSGSHDPSGHEAHGRQTADGRPPRTVPASLVRVGALVIDPVACDVRLDGESVRLTPTEWRIVAYLATRRGETIPYEEILRAVWGDAMAAVWTRGGAEQGWRAHHDITVNLVRVRQKLGPAAGLIVTETGRGLRLGDPLPPAPDAGAVLQAYELAHAAANGGAPCGCDPCIDVRSLFDALRGEARPIPEVAP